MDLNWYEVGHVPNERRLHVKEWNQCNCHEVIPWDGVSQDYIYPRICEDNPTMFRVPLWWYDEMENPSEELLDSFEHERDYRESHMEKLQKEMEQCSRWYDLAPRQKREAGKRRQKRERLHLEEWEAEVSRQKQGED